MIETLLVSIETNRRQSLESIKDDRSRHLALSAENVDLSTISSFLERYAPLQLLADRRKAGRKIRVPRRILSICTLLQTASDLVQRATTSDGSVDMDRLQATLAIDKRGTLPHPLWTTRHDAILIHAISRHGWIEQEASCRAITDDPSVIWGVPFDSPLKDSGSDGSPISAELISTAQRAASFLNSHHGCLEEIKGFNLHLVVQTYGLHHRLNGEGQAHAWEVDLDKLRISHESGTNGQEVELADLPTKKDLVKRAKSVLNRMMNTPAGTATEKATEKHGFALLDQSERCNVFLAEIMRAMLKTPVSSKYIRTLCSVALQESQKRAEETSPSLDTVSGGEKKRTNHTDLQRVWKQLQVVKQNQFKITLQCKNVVRVILGEEPLKPKHGGDSLFPSARPAAVQLWPVAPAPSRKTAKASPKASHAALRTARSTGETAIDSARKKLKETYGSPEKLSSLENNTSLLELTEIETLLLSTLCSHGMPSFTNELQRALQVSGAESCKIQSNFTWGHLGRLLWANARAELSKSSKRLKDAKEAREEAISESSKPDLMILLDLESDFVKKQAVVVQAEEYASEPECLAKKAVMLLSKVRQQWGSITVSAFTARAYNGLGTKTIVWHDKETARWARSFDLFDNDKGRPLALTAVDFVNDVKEEDRAKIQISSIFDKKACRQVIGQIAMMTRLRSFASAWKKTEFDDKIGKAVKKIVETRDVWDNEPRWWRSDESSDQNDKLLVDELVKLGLTDDLRQKVSSVGDGVGFRKMLKRIRAVIRHSCICTSSLL